MSRVAVSVRPSAAVVLIDGREHEPGFLVAPGLHIVQVQRGAEWETWTLRSEAGLDILVQHALDPAGLARPGSDERAWIGEALGEGGWLVLDEELWRWTGAEWVLANPTLRTGPAPAALKRAGGGVAAAGLLTGVAALGVGLSTKRSAEDPSRWPSATSSQDWEDNFISAEARVDASNRAQAVGWSVAAVGLATAGLGVVLAEPAAPIQLGPGGVVIRW